MSIISSIANFTSDLVKQVTPKVVQEVVHQAWYDPRLGKIVGGTFCALSGIGLLGLSGFPKKVVSWLQKRPQEPASQTKLNAKMALGGLSLIAIGAYSIWQGCQEFLLQDVNTPSPKTPTSVPNPNGCKTVEAQKNKLLSCKAKEAVDFFNSFPGGRQATVRCGNRAAIQTVCGSSSACTKVATSEVFMSHEEPEREIAWLLTFELNHLKQEEDLAALKQLGCSITDKEFAYRWEKIEYRSMQDAGAIFMKCFSEYFDPQRMPTGTISFEAFLKNAEESGHMEYYRQAHRQICKKS